MDTLKTAVVVVLLLAILYTVYVFLNKPESGPMPEDLAWHANQVDDPLEIEMDFGGADSGASWNQTPGIEAGHEHTMAGGSMTPGNPTGAAPESPEWSTTSPSPELPQMDSQAHDASATEVTAPSLLAAEAESEEMAASKPLPYAQSQLGEASSDSTYSTGNSLDTGDPTATGNSSFPSEFPSETPNSVKLPPDTASQSLYGSTVPETDSPYSASGAATAVAPSATAAAAAAIDTGPVNTGPINTGPINTGPINTGPVNTGPVNTGPVNAGPVNTGTSPAGPSGLGTTESPAITFSKFDSSLKTAMQQMELEEWLAALKTLSQAYGDPKLNAEQRKQLTTLLDSLAGRVVYSREHLIETAYIVRRGDTIANLAADFKVPWQLIANINGFSDEREILTPGTAVKVVRGPFRAQIDLADNELTLFVNDLYAGRFPVSVGNDPPPQNGEYLVRDKQPGKDYYAADGRTFSAADPSNPYGQVWIDLGGDVCIHGSAVAGQPNSSAGCISLSPTDANDLFGILSQGSPVTIRR